MRRREEVSKIAVKKYWRRYLLAPLIYRGERIICLLMSATALVLDELT